MLIFFKKVKINVGSLKNYCNFVLFKKLRPTRNRDIFMKKSFGLLSLFLLFTLLITSCKKNSDNPATGGNGGGNNSWIDKLEVLINLREIHGDGADIQLHLGTVDNTQLDPEAIVALEPVIGVCYCLAAQGEPTTEDFVTDWTDAVWEGNGTCERSIMNCEIHQTYNVRGYVIIEDRTIYSEMLQFTTGGGGDDPEGMEFTDIIGSASSLTISFHVRCVINDNNYPSDGGVCYSKTDTYPMMDNHYQSLFAQIYEGQGEADVTISVDESSEVYYIRPCWFRNGEWEYYDVYTVNMR